MRTRLLPAVLSVILLFGVALGDDSGPGSRVSTNLLPNNPRELIIGRWKPERGMENSTVEFRRNGTVHVKSDDFQIEGTYRFLNDHTMEVSMSIGGQVKSSSRLSVTVRADQLVTQKQYGSSVERFRRVR